KEHGGVQAVQAEDVPVRAVEAPDVLPGHPLARASRIRRRGPAAIEYSKEQHGREADAGDADAEPERRLPAGIVQLTRPGRGLVERVGADAGETEKDRRGERDA